MAESLYETVYKLDAAYDHKLYLIVGPSGTGKSTLARGLADNGIVEVVSHTTRAPRASERDGVDYHYVTPGEFDSLVESGAMLEHVTYSGYQYGVSRKAVEKPLMHGPACLVVEAHGAIQIKKALGADNVRVLFLMPPLPEELRRRMLARGDAPERVVERLRTVQQEVSFSINSADEGRLVDRIVSASWKPEEMLDEVLTLVDADEEDIFP